jgi:hypothetical protein
MMTFDTIAPADPFVACILRAARRGRELRQQQNETAEPGQLDGRPDPAARTEPTKQADPR